jgi:hypothetical protein
MAHVMANVISASLNTFTKAPNRFPILSIMLCVVRPGACVIGGVVGRS